MSRYTIKVLGCWDNRVVVIKIDSIKPIRNVNVAVRYSVFFLLLIGAQSSNAGTAKGYVAALGELAPLFTMYADRGELPRISNPDVRRLIVTLGDTQGFLRHTLRDERNLSIVCYAANAAVQLYLHGISGTSTYSRSSTHEELIARYVEYENELLYLKPFLSECFGGMMLQLRQRQITHKQAIDEKLMNALKIIRGLVQSDVVGAIAMVRENSLTPEFRMSSLKAVQHNAIATASVMPEEERTRMAGMIDEVRGDSTSQALIQGLNELKSTYLSVKGCNSYCEKL